VFGSRRPSQSDSEPESHRQLSRVAGNGRLPADARSFAPVWIWAGAVPAGPVSGTVIGLSLDLRRSLGCSECRVGFLGVVGDALHDEESYFDDALPGLF